MKERLTITLDSELLKKLDSTIDRVNIRNRSHAIERILDVTLSQMTPKKAVIFAGGTTIKVDDRGEVPKPMVLVNERPILEYVIRELKRNGIIDILIAIGKSGDKIISYFQDGSLFGIRLTYIKEDIPRGTENALELVKGIVGNEPFFVINGDNLFRIDLMDMYKQHVSTKATATIALATTGTTAGLGVTSLVGSRITSFVEKPGVTGENKLVSAGIYIFSPSVFNRLEQSEKALMLEKSLFPKLANSSNLYGYVFSGPWCPLDTSNIQDSLKKLKSVADALVQ
jgi:NDP-sugar pyrophosphorylase family protein